MIHTFKHQCSLFNIYILINVKLRILELFFRNSSQFDSKKFISYYFLNEILLSL